MAHNIRQPYRDPPRRPRRGRIAVGFANWTVAASLPRDDDYIINGVILVQNWFDELLEPVPAN